MSSTVQANIFRTLAPDGSVPLYARARFLADDDRMRSVIHDAESLLDSAASFFCGLYPVETPHFPWGALIPLPWMDDYMRPEVGGGSTSKRVDIGPEVMAVAQPLLNEGYGKCSSPFYGVTYMIVSEDSEQLTMQSLAVEVMLAVDRFLELLKTDLPGSLPWLTLAYQNIIECVLQAQRILVAPYGRAVDQPGDRCPTSSEPRNGPLLGRH
jgi:hypothetical protein